MMKTISSKLKDWEVAREVYGKNTKMECKSIKILRKHGIVTTLCEDYSIITDSREEDDCGCLIPNSCLE